MNEEIKPGYREMNYSITKNGKDARHLCVIDEKNKTVSTKENGLVFDFSGLNEWVFKTGYNCIFNTGFDCTFDTGSICTFDTDSNCTFKTGFDCVIVRRDIFEVIKLTSKQNNIQLCPNSIKGYIQNNVYSETDKPAIIADGILSEILSEKKVKDMIIYKVINYNEKEKTYLIKRDDVYSHGKTLEEAK